MNVQQVFTTANAVDTFEIGGGAKGTPVGVILFPCTSLGDDFANRLASRGGTGMVTYKDTTITQGFCGGNVDGTDGATCYAARAQSQSGAYVACWSDAGGQTINFKYACTGVGVGGGLLFEREVVDGGGNTYGYEMAFNCMVFYPGDTAEIETGVWNGGGATSVFVPTGFNPNLVFTASVGAVFTGADVVTSNAYNALGVGFRNEFESTWTNKCYSTRVSDNTASMTCASYMNNTNHFGILSSAALARTINLTSDSGGYTNNISAAENEGYMYMAIKLPDNYFASFQDWIRLNSTTSRTVWTTGRMEPQITMTTFISFASSFDTTGVKTSSTYSLFNSLTDSEGVTATSNWAADDANATAKAKDTTSTNSIKGTSYNVTSGTEFVADFVIPSRFGPMQSFTSAFNSTVGWVLQIGKVYNESSGVRQVFVGSDPVESFG